MKVTNENNSFTKADITRFFNDAANTYDESAVVQNTVGERLSERLEF